MSMSASRGFSRFSSGAVLALALGSCTSVPAEPETPGYDDLVALAQASAEAGHTRAALDAYKRAAAADPARKQPWQQIALLHLEAGRPVQALAAAEATLQRDPADAIANKVFIASGLQVARDALQRLRAAGDAPTDDDRARARDLVAVMGQVFGAESLVPEDVKVRYAKRAAEQCKAAQADLLKAERSKQPDPLDMLGGD